jgi:type I restriction enzyme S subunit
MVGRAVIVRATRSKLMLSDKLLRLRVQAGRMNAGFLNFVLSSAHSRVQIEDGATGSSQSMKNISQETLRSIRVPVPSLDEQKQIVGLVDAAAERSNVALEYGASLLDLKAALMSTLLTGELRVTPDPEPA